MRFLQDNFPFPFLFAAAWIGLFFIASLLYRRSQAKPIFRPVFNQPLFLATWLSGRSLRSTLSRLGGANNCLWVAVTDSTLHVGSHFPFNMMFLPEIYRMEYALPASAIRSVDLHPRLFGRNWVRVTFERDDGALEDFELRLPNPEAFISAIAEIQRE